MSFQKFNTDHFLEQLDQASFTSESSGYKVISTEAAKNILLSALHEYSNNVLDEVYTTAMESIKSINTELGDDKDST